jgi:hypothetical protein
MKYLVPITEWLCVTAIIIACLHSCVACYRIEKRAQVAEANQ